MDSGVKTCSSCRVAKSFKAFRTRRGKNNNRYLRPECRVCSNRMSANWRKANRDKIIRYREKLPTAVYTINLGSLNRTVAKQFDECECGNPLPPGEQSPCERCALLDGRNASEAEVISVLRSCGGAASHGHLLTFVSEAAQKRRYRALRSLIRDGRIDRRMVNDFDDEGDWNGKPSGILYILRPTDSLMSAHGKQTSLQPLVREQERQD